MSDTCDACRSIVDAKCRIKCTKCPLVYHLECVAIAISEVNSDVRANFICPCCRNSEPKGDRSNTPVRLTTKKITSKPVTERQKKIAAAAAAAAGVSSASAAAVGGTGGKIADNSSRPDQLHVVTPPPAHEVQLPDLALLLSEIKLLRQDMNVFKQQIHEVLASCNRRMDEIENSLSAAAYRIMELEASRVENLRLSAHVKQLEETIERKTQASLRNELEIVGLPESNNENLTHLVQIIAAKVGCKIQEDEIDWVDRVGPKLNNRKTVNTGDGPRSRLIVVRFLRRSRRDTFLKAAKGRSNLTSCDVTASGLSNKIYVNERLSKSCRQLFHEARKRSKSLGIQFCWTRHGTIFIRKAEGRPAITIQNVADLDLHLYFNDTNAEGIRPEEPSKSGPATPIPQ